MTDPLTKQGVRDLGGNVRRGLRDRHAHVYGQVVVGWKADPLDYEATPIHDARCLVCGRAAP